MEEVKEIHKRVGNGMENYIYLYCRIQTNLDRIWMFRYCSGWGSRQFCEIDKDLFLYPLHLLSRISVL